MQDRWGVSAIVEDFGVHVLLSTVINQTLTGSAKTNHSTRQLQLFHNKCNFEHIAATGMWSDIQLLR